jgi:serine/threonine-protein kinase
MAWANGPLRPGETFLSKYEVRDLIGQGGNACVYHAVNSFMGRHVAIKVLHRAGGIDRESLRRGQAEAQILNRLRHPSIVEVIDAGITDTGLLYIVMELLRGRSFRDVVNEHGALTVDEVLDLALQVADGVHAAHQMGVIHRDLKPENLFVTSGSRVKILDFGIAKIADAAAWTTDKEVAHGTVLYMSPEQLELQKLTPASDVYTLGVIMYEALVGKHPIPMVIDTTLPNNWQIQRAVLTRALPMLDEVDARIPRNVATLVNRATAKRPTERFATMEELASEVRQCRAGWHEYARAQGIPLVARDLSVPSTAITHTVPLVPRSSTPEPLSAPRGSGRPELDTEPPKFGAISSFLPRDVATEPTPGPHANSARHTVTPSTEAAVATAIAPSNPTSISSAPRRRALRVLAISSLVGGTIGGSAVFLKLTGDRAASGASAPPSATVTAPAVEPAASPASPAVPSPPSATAFTATAAATVTPEGRAPNGVAPLKIQRTGAPPKSSATTRTPPADKVEERLLRLEKSLEPERQ